MSATQVSVANGARLDDCHSSIFSLADLTGLRWKKFTATLSIPANPSDDPILEAFSRCLSQDILAVWRRSPNVKRQQSHFQDDEMNTSATWELKKELWIFWWGNEPSVEDIGHITGITVEPEGSWEEQGLSYECRSLLFKAIHNLVERCLLADNFIRVGKWFLRPYSEDKDHSKSERLSCSFTFFLRGELTVCTTVEIARHQHVETLTEHHLHLAANGNSPFNVILSPYGLRASLTGVACRSQHEPQVKKVIEEWKHFYPLLQNNESLDCDDYSLSESTVPPVVEVIVAGVRMSYPSAYVLLPVSSPSSSVDGLDSIHQRKKESGYPNLHSVDESMLGSINSSISEMVSTTLPHEMTSEDSYGNLKKIFDANFSLKKSSSTAVDLLSRILNQCQAILPPPATPRSKESVTSSSDTIGITERPPSYWSCLLSPLKKIRQKLNASPFKEEENENFLQTRQGPNLHNDQTPSTLKAFHHENIKTLMANPANPLNQCYPNAMQADCQMMPYNASPGDCYPLAPYYAPELPIEFPPDTCETLFQADGSNLNASVHNHVTSNYDAVSAAMNEASKSLFPVELQNSKEYIPSTQEIRTQISQWKKFKLPPNRYDKLAEGGHDIGPNVVPDTLDFPCATFQGSVRTMKRLKHCSGDAQREWSWTGINCKKRKIEDDNGFYDEKESLPVQGQSQLDKQNIQSEALAHHVTVGSVTGELAGMTVPSDPYDFEEDEKDSSMSMPFNPSYSTDINIKVSGLWSSEDNIDVRKETENILKQEDFQGMPKYQDTLPTPFTPGMQGTLNPKQTHLLTDKKDLKVSLGDLEKLFNESEDDDVGVLTPPDDHGNEDHIQMSNSTFQGSKYDLPMFPTPPSMESCKSYSPEEDYSNAVSQTSFINSKPSAVPSTGLSASKVGTAGTSPCNLEDVCLGQTFYNGELSKSFRGVFEKNPIIEHPMPNKYFPMKNLPSLKKYEQNEENLPQQFLYTPSWQMDSYMNQRMEVETDIGYRLMNNNATHSMPADTVAPLTPIYSVSVQTPASVTTQQSPANFSTPAPRTPRNNVDLLSPASSIATPATLGRIHQMTPLSAVSSSVGQSETGVCRASSIYMNLMLSDSVLNLFRDVSFDQCAMCVCNDNYNIHSRDVELGYLPSLADNVKESQYPCLCGFSAVRNRCLSVNAGLFLEDELEIIGKDLEKDVLKTKQDNFRRSDENTRSLVQFALNQSRNPHYGSHYAKPSQTEFDNPNIASTADVMEACVEAINGGILVMDIVNQPKIKVHNCRNILHPWAASSVYVSSSSTDVCPMLQYLKPVLQNAIQRLRSERSFNFIQRVNGPLTWREFCKDNSYALEPLPVPLLLVGQNYDWMTVSPFSLNYWERLYLEPYAGTTSVFFITMCPDIEHVAKSAKIFFQELSSVYEQCRLGTHRPFIRNSKENGIFYVGKDSPSNAAVAPEWFKAFVDKISKISNAEGAPQHEIESEVMDCVNSYVEACRQTLDVLFNTSEQTTAPKQPTPNALPPSMQGNEMGKPGSMRPPTPVPHQHPIIAKLGGREGVLPTHNLLKHWKPEDGSIVIYFVDPFSDVYSSSFSLSIWKCFMGVLDVLPENLRKSLSIQLVPLKNIVQFSGQENQSDIQTVRSLAFSTHTQCRSIVSHAQARTMTAFGPAASRRDLMKERVEKTALSTIYSPAFVLSNTRRRKKNCGIELEQTTDESNVLYVSYCLSHDQKWLLASATDQDGEMLETFCVNIEVPPRRVSLHRKQRICVKSTALLKLWNFCLAIVTRSASVHWRIVIGRLGRLSHGEIQEWSKHLNRKNLCDLSKQLCSSCKQCMKTGFRRHQKIISACLTSLEAEGSFTIFPDWVKVAPFGRNSSGGMQVQLKTPEDASCTHIYVFPTSSLVQAAGGTFQAEGIDFVPGDSSFQLPDFVEQDENMLMVNVNDLFDPTSPGNNMNQTTDDITAQLKSQADRLMSNEGANEETSLLQQPLALGYLVSTAPTGPLPDFFWVSCPHAKYQCPVFLRFALHIQVSKDEVPNAGESIDDNHQLDSDKTDQVLRYVLENYDALSWLTYDPVYRDRSSCLPLHYFVLARLFYSIKELT